MKICSGFEARSSVIHGYLGLTKTGQQVEAFYTCVTMNSEFSVYGPVCIVYDELFPKKHLTVDV